MLSLQAQDRWDSAIPLSDEYVITGATVYVTPTDVRQDVNLWIADGKVKQIGNFTIPLAAEVIEADSMYIYPGFILGASHAAIPKPKDDKPDRPSRPGTPTDAQAGITPEKSAVDQLSGKSGDIEGLRKQGFTLAHTVPHGKSFPGQGAVILLGSNPEGKDELPITSQVLKQKHSLYSTLRGSGRMYPSTVIGVMAKWRELYRGAELAHQHEELYARDKSVDRPSYAHSFTALYPVISGKQDVYFATGNALAARRVAALQEELGFALVMTDVTETWDIMSLLDEPFLLSLDLPKEPAESKDKKMTDEMKMHHDRQMKSYHMYLNQADTLAHAGKKYGFSQGEAKTTDLMKNIKMMVAEGLSEVEALTALTTTPADLLDVSDVTGSLRTGMMANLIISNEPIFTEKSKLRYVFVEGTMYEYNKAKKSDAKVNGDVASVLGSWSYTADVPGETITGVVTIVDNDGTLGGTMVSDQDGETTELESVGLEDDELTIGFVMEQEGFDMPMSITVTIDGDTFTGTVSAGQFGEFPFSGQKIPE